MQSKTSKTPKGFTVERIYKPDPEKMAKALQTLLEYQPPQEQESESPKEEKSA